MNVKQSVIVLGTNILRCNGGENASVETPTVDLEKNTIQTVANIQQMIITLVG